MEMTQYEIMSDIVLSEGEAAAGAGAAAAAGGGAELGRRLLAAARGGHTAQVLELLARGAAFTADWLGTGPLHLAAAGGHADTCGVLLRAGVSRDARTKVERTPLHAAAAGGHAAACGVLLAHGAAPDARDLLRMTPLHWACERGHAAAAALLVRAGADLAALSKFNKTPRQLAAARRHAATLRAIDQALADRDAAPPPDPNEESSQAEQQRALESIEKPPAPPAPDPVQSPHTPAAASAAGPTLGGAAGAGGVPLGAAGAGGVPLGAAGAAALLRRHGITLLPRDDSSTVLNAIHSGRTVVLSDAGKLMLKESVPATPVTPVTVVSPVSVTPLTPVTPVSSPLVVSGRVSRGRAVKVLTVNNNVVSLADNVQTQNTSDVQIKLLSVPASEGQGKAGVGKAGVGGVGKAGVGKPVKIIMHKANLNKLLAAAAPAQVESLSVEEQLRAARRQVARLSHEVAHLKRRLALYEPV